MGRGMDKGLKIWPVKTSTYEYTYIRLLRVYICFLSPNYQPTRRTVRNRRPRRTVGQPASLPVTTDQPRHRSAPARHDRLGVKRPRHERR